MFGIVFQSIKLAPRLFWQSLFQPSKAYEFTTKEKKNRHILVWSFFFIGLFMGSLLAIPHYYLYNNLLHSTLFVFSFTVAFTVAGAFALAFALTIEFAGGFAVLGLFAFLAAAVGANAFAIAGAGANTFAIDCLGVNAVAIDGAGAVAIVAAIDSAIAAALAIAGAIAGAIALTIAGAGAVLGASPAVRPIAGAIVGALLTIALIVLGAALLSPAAIMILLLLSGAGWFILYFNSKGNVRFNENIEMSIGFTVYLLMVFAGGGGVPLVKVYEMVIFSLAFLVGYIFISAFDFLDENEKFKENFRASEVKDDDLTHQKFAQIQKASLIWGPLLALIISLPIYFGWVPQLHTKILIAAVGLMLMPLFILHIPDYLLCLPFWFHQRRKIINNSDDSAGMMKAYNTSLLFKHEMLYFPLPGLHKVIAALARNKEIGIKKTAAEIDYIFWFTFQQKQAEKSILEIGKNSETANWYIHLLLEENNLYLLNILAEKNVWPSSISCFLTEIGLNMCVGKWQKRRNIVLIKRW